MANSAPEVRAAYREANREKLAALQREYRERNLDRIKEQRRDAALAIREYQRTYSKGWRKRNAAKVTANKAAYYQENAEEIKARASAWVAANRDRARTSSRISARRRLLGKDGEAQDYGELLRGDPCSYCGEPAEAVDHIHAVSRGGTNDMTNLTAACRSCNSHKGTRSLLTFLSEGGMRVA